MPYVSDYPEPPLPKCGTWHFHHPERPEFDPALPAYIDGVTGRTLSRADVKNDSLRMVTGLRKLGVKRGDTTCIWGLNSLEWIQAAWGCMAAGMTISPANYAFSPKELAYQINNSGSTVIFTEPWLLENLDKARPMVDKPIPDSHVILLCLPKDKPQPSRYKCVSELYLMPGRAEAFSGEQIHDTQFLCYSSGTTGLPKGVMSTHWNFTSQMQCLKPSYQKLGPNDRMLGFVPLSHTYGVTMVLQQPFSVGACAVILPRFDEIACLRALEKFKVVHTLIVPPIVIVLLNSEHLPKFDLSSLRTLMSAAAPLGKDLIDAFLARLPHCRITQGYGLTETSPICHIFCGEEAVAGREGWVGRLLPYYQARLVDPATGKDAEEGQPGELYLRGPCVMKGYHNNPEATAKTMDGDWFITGDVLIRDNAGWYKVVDRVKELIKYKGFQVPPAELEALLLTHPKIKDVGVVGVYDASQATELPTAFVCIDPEEDISTAEKRAWFDKEIQAWVAARAARHKRLGGGVHVVDAIPKTPSGKILRRFLRDRAEKERAERIQLTGTAKL